MSHVLRLHTSPTAPEETTDSSLVTSKLHYRSRGPHMEKDGGISLPGSSRHAPFPRSPSDSSISNVYPPQENLPKEPHDHIVDIAKKPAGDAGEVPRICGLPLKYVSFVNFFRMTEGLAYEPLIPTSDWSR